MEAVRNRGRSIYFPEYFGIKAFPVIVQGDSMKTTRSNTSYAHGDMIFIDPSVAPRVGNCVIARRFDGTELFRRLETHQGIRHLKALNPAIFPRLLPLTDECKILGVCISKLSREF